MRTTPSITPGLPFFVGVEFRQQWSPCHDPSGALSIALPRELAANLPGIGSPEKKNLVGINFLQQEGPLASATSLRHQPQPDSHHGSAGNRAAPWPPAALESSRADAGVCCSPPRPWPRSACSFPGPSTGPGLQHRCEPASRRRSGSVREARHRKTYLSPLFRL